MSSSRKRATRDSTVLHSTPQQQQQQQQQQQDIYMPSSKLPNFSCMMMTAPEPQRRLTVRIKRFHAVAQWSWNAGDPGDVCSICQNAYESTAPGIKYPGEDCPVVFGKCKHAFHLQCVSKWLNQVSSKNSCPICRSDWEFGSNPTVNGGGEAAPVAVADNNNDEAAIANNGSEVEVMEIN